MRSQKYKTRKKAASKAPLRERDPHAFALIMAGIRFEPTMPKDSQRIRWT